MSRILILSVIISLVELFHFQLSCLWMGVGDDVEDCTPNNSISKTTLQALVYLGPAEGGINGKLEDGKKGKCFPTPLYLVVLRQQLQ